MDFKDVAIDDLRKHEQRKQSITSLKEKIQALEYNKMALGGISDSTPVQTSGNKQETKLINIICEQGKLNNQLQAVIKYVDRLERALNSIGEKERKVLEIMYINPQKDYIGRLQTELGYEKTHIYRIKDKALYDLTISLYGIEDL